VVDWHFTNPEAFERSPNREFGPKTVVQKPDFVNNGTNNFFTNQPKTTVRIMQIQTKRAIH
jgi:hypothetical protein